MGQTAAQHKLLHGDEEYFANYFSWCGHVARMTASDPKCETCRMYLNKNKEWLRNLKNEVGSQCHGECGGGSKRWHSVGTEWVKMAQYRAVWRSKAGEMIKWRKKVGGPGVYSD